MLAWITGVIQKHFWRVIVYTAVSVCVIIVIFLAMKDRITQKTTVEKGGVVNHYFENSQIKSTFGCQSLGAEKYMRMLKENK